MSAGEGFFTCSLLGFLLSALQSRGLLCDSVVAPAAHSLTCCGAGKIGKVEKRWRQRKR